MFPTNGTCPPKLTLTLGLRYELPTVAQSPNGTVNVLNAAGTALIPANDPPSYPLPTVPLSDPQHNAFAPRFGFAYRATKDVGGARRIWHLLQCQPVKPVHDRRQSTVLQRGALHIGPCQSNSTLANPTAGAPVGASPTPNIVTFGPYLAYGNGEPVEPGCCSSACGAGPASMCSIWARARFIWTVVITTTRRSPGPGPSSRGDPIQRWGVIRTIANDMVASYNSLNVVLRQRYSRGFSMLLSYTWSHTLDVSTDSNGGGSAMDPYNWKGSYGNANWDMRHRFVASYFYELPFFKTSKHWGHYVLGGWQINAITTLQSGTPINVTISTDPPNTGRPGGMRPDLIAPAVADCGSGRLVGCLSAASFRMPVHSTMATQDVNLTGPVLWM